jgi:hypothetical protein
MDDADLRQMWQDFHFENAKLRWITKEGNKKIGDSGYAERKAQSKARDMEFLKNNPGCKITKTWGGNRGPFSFGI